MIQTLALLHDAYRELNARKLFWVSLLLSGLVVGAFATVGINARGWSVLWFEVPSIVNTSIVSRETFFKLVFSNYGVDWWLNFVAIVLALISTAAIIPDFVAGGSIDLYISRPIGRLRLLLTKYLTGLLFVALQVLVFTAACFVLIRLRVGGWDLRLFFAVPLALLVFSYLFCVCTLLGLLTRSTIASLLLTILFWLLVFGVDASESLLLKANTAAKLETQAYERQFTYADKLTAMLNKRLASGDSTAQLALQTAMKNRAELEEKKRVSDPARQNLATAHAILYRVKSLLPKTGETSALLRRWLELDDAKLEEEEFQQRQNRRAAVAAAGGWFGSFQDRTEIRLKDPEVIREATHIVESRNVSWILGSSLAFEGVVLTLAAWIFCRRDF